MSDSRSGAKSEPDARDGLYPIRTVARVTGVNPVTLRAWERRYGLIRPHRTQSGHRVYTSEHIDEIRHILDLVGSGMSIGQVGPLLEAKSASEVLEDRQDDWEKYRGRMMSAIQYFDELRVDDVYNEAMGLYPVDVVTTRLIVPVLQELGRRWRNRTGTVAEEHFFSSDLRNKLGARIHHRSRRASGHRLMLACLEGERHEIGALLFALSAVDRSFRIIYLGADVPTGDLVSAQDKAQCSGIVLSGTSEPTGYDFGAALASLVEGVGVPVFVGGGVCSYSRTAIEGSGAILLGTDLAPALNTIELQLGPGPGRGGSRPLERPRS